MSSLIANQHLKALSKAAEATHRFIHENYGGDDGGPCGFAWVTAQPRHKGNTRAGREERRQLESIGFRKDYTGKSWRLNNPSGYPGQSVDARYAGARAYAEFMNELGAFDLYAEDRLD